MKIRIKQATKKGYIEMENGGVADFSYPTSQMRRGRVQEGGRISPTIMSSNSGVCKVDAVWGGLQEHQTKRTDGISPSLTAAMGMGGGQTPVMAVDYRIRKLTPRECWRLMSFTDEDYEKAASVNSQTQLYKQAGNSIVKEVLMAIFTQIIDGDEEKEV